MWGATANVVDREFRSSDQAVRQGSPMREATIHIPHEEYRELGFGDLIDLVQEAGLRDVTELVCQSEGCLVAVTVDEPVDAASLDAIDCLDWWEALSSRGSESVYLCKVTFPDGDGAARPLYNRDLSNEEIAVGETGLSVTLVGDQDDIAAGIDDYGAAGMTVLLQSITDYDGPEQPMDSLTGRQREILETAYEAGYFDVPRTASTADLASALDLDPSTVAEHLQRAERNLVGSVLESA